MNYFSKTITTFVLLLAVGLPASANASLHDGWMALIKAELPAKCEVSIIKTGVIVSGKDGSRDEQWFVRTCKGNREYWVYYYPPSAFPGRISPYAVVRVHSRV